MQAASLHFGDHIHLFLHRLLAHILLPAIAHLCHDYLSALDQRQHHASNERLFHRSLRPRPNGEHATSHCARNDRIHRLIDLPEVNEQTVDRAEATTPHGERATDIGSSIPDVCQSSNNPLSDRRVKRTCKLH